jgi:hypothetical protein
VDDGDNEKAEVEAEANDGGSATANDNDDEGEQVGNDDDEVDDNDDNEVQANDEGDNYDYPSDWETIVGPDGIVRPMSIFGMNKYINIGTVPTTNFAEKHATQDQMKDVVPKSFHKKQVRDKIDDQELKKPTTGRIISFPNWVQVSRRDTSTILLLH